jgi:hypothetical protein
MPKKIEYEDLWGNNKAEAEAPKAEAPKAEAPKADAPKADAPKAEAPKADAPKAEENPESNIVLNDVEEEEEEEKQDEQKKPPTEKQMHANRDQLNTLSALFLNQRANKYSEIEMEAKFGTRGIKYLTKSDYDNVAKKIISSGWTAESTGGQYMMRIHPEFLDAKTGKFRTNERFRIEIQGLNYVQEYCKTNSIRAIHDKSSFNVGIHRKFPLMDETQGKPVASANFDDWNFRVSLNTEERVSKTGKIGQEVFENWNKSKKTFRYINRVAFTHPDHAFKIDMSIVKSSSRNERGWYIQTYNVADSGVFNNPESFEIEIEVDYLKARRMYSNPAELSAGLQRIVTLVLSGLQRTNYPVSYFEQREVMQQYYQMLHGEPMHKKNIHSSDFLGPSLVTLDIQNIAPLNPDIAMPNITEPFAYCVTEKADGDRHLLYVDKTGRIYLINMNMNVIFTGAKTREQNCFHSILDGELILHNLYGVFINTFAAFDIYYINRIDIRERPFLNTPILEPKYKEECRLNLLQDFVKQLNPEKIGNAKLKINSPIHIQVKHFYPLFDKMTDGKDTKYSIFEANYYLLRKIADKNFDYEIDGLIFTPTLYGVGGSAFMEAGPKKKITWPHLFKWKPSEATAIFPKSYNTIDFLVVTKKGADGLDIVTPMFENGQIYGEATQFKQYKTLILAVGFDPSRHGYINPCQDVLDDKYVSNGGQAYDAEDEGYKPKQFYPSDPFDPNAGLCHIMLENDSNGTYQMFTEERQVFGDQMVVEFRYDPAKPGLWKWVPLRVRYDKTSEFRTGQGVGANDYKTANSNWRSIHYPVTERMISTGEGIPSAEVSDDVYYNGSSSDKLTRGMRDFHNLYVKKMLIASVSKKSDILIDFACGKAGDLPKWIHANLSFVFGIDISKDNIENRINGACARYLNFKKTTKVMPFALFVHGNSSLHIRSGTNMFSDKGNQIVNAVFGKISADHGLGPAVARQYGKGRNGFDVSSCQFAIHYMFENKRTFYQFLRNVAECTKLYGYFIGTCYDGRSVFQMLRRKQKGESEDIFVDGKKVWSITKQYDISTLDNDESSLSQKIDVYQDTINQSITEYLVNFDFLVSSMEKYGFALVTKEEARMLKIPDGSGMFSELNQQMEREVSQRPEKQVEYKEALYMTDYEKKISFLNRYFVFKKMSTRNAEKLTIALLSGNDAPEEEPVETKVEVEPVAKELPQNPKKPKVTQLKKKLRLVEATEAQEQPEMPPIQKKKNTRKKRIIVNNSDDDEK